MRKLFGLAVIAMLLAPTMASADFTDDFSGTTLAEVGTGNGAGYVPGAWYVYDFAAYTESGRLRTNYQNAAYPGAFNNPNYSRPAWIYWNGGDLAGGTYTATATSPGAGGEGGFYRAWVGFGYQNQNEFFYVHNQYGRIEVGYRQYDSVSGNYVGTVLAQSEAYTVVGDDQGTIVINWDPAANTIGVQYDVKSYDGTPKLSGTLNMTDPNVWESGKFALGSWNGMYYDYASFTAVPEPATMTMLVLGGLGALLRRKK